MLVPFPAACNPFMSMIMPIAVHNDLVMHSVLALSGAHHLGRDAIDPALVSRATWSHYAAVVGSLRSELVDSEAKSGDTVKTLRIIVVLVLLCHYEVISGNTQGNMFQHLRATRQLMLSLRCRLRSPLTDTCRQLLGLMVELYSYIVLTNIFTPHAATARRDIAFDPFLLHEEAVTGSEWSGVMFGGLHGLLELIPLVSVFAAQRLREDAVEGDKDTRERQGKIGPSPRWLETHKILKNRIDNWRLPLYPDSTNDPSTSTSTILSAIIIGMQKERQTAGEAYRHALSIYLSCALQGQLCTDQATHVSIQTHATAILDLTNNLVESLFDYTMVWPAIICGSCLVDETLRQFFLACLETLWQDPDPRAFGPYGLYLVMEKHGFTFCTL